MGGFSDLCFGFDPSPVVGAMSAWRFQKSTDFYNKMQAYDDIIIWGVTNKPSTDYISQEVTLLGAT